MATNERCSGLHECDGVFHYSAHHHYIVVLPHYHDRYTALRRTLGKHELYGVNSHHITCVLPRSFSFCLNGWLACWWTVSFIGYSGRWGRMAEEAGIASVKLARLTSLVKFRKGSWTVTMWLFLVRSWGSLK